MRRARVHRLNRNNQTQGQLIIQIRIQLMTRFPTRNRTLSLTRNRILNLSRFLVPSGLIAHTLSWTGIVHGAIRARQGKAE